MIKAYKPASMIVFNILLILFGCWETAIPLLVYTATAETISTRSLAQTQQDLPLQPTPPSLASPSPIPPELALRKLQLENEKLIQELKKLQREGNWFWNNGATVGTVLVAAVAGFIGLFRWLADRQEERRKRGEEHVQWLADRQEERKKRGEERFQSVVEGLGKADLATKIGAAVTLRTFLQKGYEDFYVQVFNLAVAF